MEVLTHGNTTVTWEREAAPLRGLEGALARHAEVLLYSPDPHREIDELISAIALYEMAGGPVDTIAVAGPFPSREWTERVRSAGVSHVYLAPERHGLCHDFLHAEDLREVPSKLCPALDVRAVRGGPMSVCGMKNDRLVLGERQYGQYCFGGWDACPHFATGTAPQGANGRVRVSTEA
jgi:hypothetical protein